MVRTIDVGLVGCGRIMPVHLQGYREIMDGADDVLVAPYVLANSATPKDF